MANNFSKNLKHLRIQKGLTQEELAKRLEKDYSTIGKWENGTRSPIMSDVLKVADYFDIPIGDLITSNLSLNNFDELELLFSKNKDILTEDDKDYIKFIIAKRKKEIDEEKGID